MAGHGELVFAYRVGTEAWPAEILSVELVCALPVTFLISSALVALPLCSDWSWRPCEVVDSHLCLASRFLRLGCAGRIIAWS